MHYSQHPSLFDTHLIISCGAKRDCVHVYKMQSNAHETVASQKKKKHIGCTSATTHTRDRLKKELKNSRHVIAKLRVYEEKERERERKSRNFDASFYRVQSIHNNRSRSGAHVRTQHVSLAKNVLGCATPPIVKKNSLSHPLLLMSIT